MHETVIAATLTGLTGLVGTLAAGPLAELGWTRRALRLIEVYDALPKDPVLAVDRSVTGLLEGRIFATVMRGMGYDLVDGVPERVRPLWRTALVALSLCAAVSLAGGVLTGRLTDPLFWLRQALAMAIGTAIGNATHRILKRHPKRPWNKVYMAERKAREVHEERKRRLERMQARIDANLAMRSAADDPEVRIDRQPEGEQDGRDREEDAEEDGHPLEEFVHEPPNDAS